MASSSMAASPHPRADLPRITTLMQSDSPDRSASCGLRRDSGKPGRHGFCHGAHCAVDPRPAPMGPCRTRRIKKSPDHRDRRLFKPAQGRWTVLWRMSGPKTGWRRSYAARKVNATHDEMSFNSLILLNQSRCQTASMKSTACFSAIRA
ncbi:hypothetical protein BN126310079 [Stenotrophomonas indicatrix]|nr:hypothetical protein BN126310079 [Stenotrophomonas indicatrix]